MFMEYLMKRMIASTFAILFALTAVINASAQTAESIWLTASTMAYKTGEAVLVTLNASSTTPMQGFTFQIRYDPACLRPVTASSPIPGMNGLPLPQLTGLVDGSYASTTPQTVNGVLAEVRFTALKGCQTGLTLESAALAIRNAEGFAVPLSSVLIGERYINLFIDSEVGASQPAPAESGSVLPLAPPEAEQGMPGWIIGIVPALLVCLLMLAAYRRFRNGTAYGAKSSKPSAGTRKAALHIKHGPQAGKSFALNKFPFVIGRDPQNDICINDPHVIGRHAQIYAERNGYYLRDLGGGTFINGRPVKGSTVVLHAGDVVRLGRSALFVFG
jgi:hypothetical protein